jgi:SAM-dependent methyltransferase
VLRDNRFGLPHTVRIGWCDVCGLGVTQEPPSSAELAELYASTYADESTSGRIPRTSAAARLWHRVNGSLPLSDLPLEPTILDVGCNTGETLLALRARGLEAVGLEPNPRAAAIARSAGLDVIEAPIESAVLEPGRYGTILLSQVLEHVHDPAGVLQTARAALAPGGAVVIVVPNADSVWRRIFGQNWVHWHVPFHLFHFTRRALLTLLTQSGFTIRSLQTRTPGEWLLLSAYARRNARAGRYELDSFTGRYGRRLLLAAPARAADAVGRGDAILAVAIAP